MAPPRRLLKMYGVARRAEAQSSLRARVCLRESRTARERTTYDLSTPTLYLKRTPGKHIEKHDTRRARRPASRGAPYSYTAARPNRTGKTHQRTPHTHMHTHRSADCTQPGVRRQVYKAAESSGAQRYHRMNPVPSAAMATPYAARSSCSVRVSLEAAWPLSERRKMMAGMVKHTSEPSRAPRIATINPTCARAHRARGQAERR